MAALALLGTTHAGARLMPARVNVSICYPDANPGHCIPAQGGKVSTAGNVRNGTANGQLTNRTNRASKAGGVKAARPNIDCPGKCSAELGDVTKVTFTAWEAQGKYEFDQWVGDCSSKTPRKCVVNANSRNVTVKAVFKQYDPSYPDQGP